MGNSLLTIPNVTKEKNQGSGPGFNWGVASMQGWKACLQDAFICEPTFGHLKTFSLFLVMDGFRGNIFSNKVSRNLVNFILKHETFMNLKDGDAYDPTELASALKECLTGFDDQMRDDENEYNAGCTVSGALITPKHFLVLNLGDSRTLLCRNSKLFFNTEDHKPVHFEERKRIEAAGGQVTNSRINGKLEISRGLGAFDYKGCRKRKACQMLSSEADVTVINRKNDDFLAIASDGLFFNMSMAEWVRYLVTRIPYKRQLQDLAGDALDYSMHSNESKDDLTLIIVHFNGSPITQEPTKMDHDEKLDEKIREHTREYVAEAFADGKAAYGWFHCFKALEKDHSELFSDNFNTQNYGISLKKGVIYDQFRPLVNKIRETRSAEAYRQMKEHEKQESAKENNDPISN